MIDRSYYCICVEWAWGPGQAKPLTRQASWLLAPALFQLFLSDEARVLDIFDSSRNAIDRWWKNCSMWNVP